MVELPAVVVIPISLAVAAGLVIFVAGVRRQLAIREGRI